MHRANGKSDLLGSLPTESITKSWILSPLLLNNYMFLSRALLIARKILKAASTAIFLSVLTEMENIKVVSGYRTASPSAYFRRKQRQPTTLLAPVTNDGRSVNGK